MLVQKYFSVIDSTNTEASRVLDAAYGSEGSFISCHKQVLWTQKQTAGRGRMNRAFFSPESGVYMSFIYCPGQTILDPAIYTASAAVIVCRAIKKFYRKDCSIKWVNDIYSGSKKVCGILTEGKIDLKKGSVGALVVGIGINIFTPPEDFPLELRDKAGSVVDNRNDAGKVQPADLVSQIADEVFAVYDNPELINEIMDEYKARSNLIGKKIIVSPVINQNEENYEAEVTGITDDARLIVQLNNGERRELSSGEVSLHQNKNL